MSVGIGIGGGQLSCVHGVHRRGDGRRPLGAGGAELERDGGGGRGRVLINNRHGDDDGLPCLQIAVAAAHPYRRRSRPATVPSVGAALSVAGVAAVVSVADPSLSLTFVRVWRMLY